jgi:beta-barrel assembly-enhancing protease
MSENYVPKPDPEGINTPKKNTPIRDLAVLLAGFFGIVLVCFVLLTFVGDFIVSRISLQQEMRYLGGIWESKTFAVEKNPKFFDEFVELLNKHLYFPLKVSVMCEKEPNAFALPGGKVFVTSGLFDYVESENGLAFVLGHEIGHFINRDHIRGVSRQIFFGIFAAMFGFHEVGGFSSMGGLIDSAYGRGDETQADTYALGLMNKVYGHTWGADEFFATMAKDESAAERALARFASTHPASWDRVTAIRATQTGEKRELKSPSKPFEEWAAAFKCSASGEDRREGDENAEEAPTDDVPAEK